jgi:AraC-like DNA-binding protein
MDSTIAYTSLLGLFLPIVLLYFNKGYRTANRYLAGFLFFAALYVLENFYFFYGISLNKIAFFTLVHSFFYLIGPFAFFYVRSILRDHSKLNKVDYLHFALFAISFVGYVPYFLSSWDYKLEIAQNLQGENWDISPFHLNSILPHKVDQVLNVLHTYFYSISLWYLLWHYKKKTNNPIIHNRQYKLIRNWLFVFASILTIITLNFTVAMAGIWLYDEKSLFLERTGIALLFASLVYIGMNMVILFFPHIMYGLPIALKVDATLSEGSEVAQTNPSTFAETGFSIAIDSPTQLEKNELLLFTDEYISAVESSLEMCKVKKIYLNTDFKLIQISKESGIPAHHLTYYFNDIKQVSFSEWRNSLRIKYAMKLIGQGETNAFTLQSIAQQAGFASQNTFIRAFKNVTGTTPSAYSKSVS